MPARLRLGGDEGRRSPLSRSKILPSFPPEKDPFDETIRAPCGRHAPDCRRRPAGMRRRARTGASLDYRPDGGIDGGVPTGPATRPGARDDRSEEHTSELQSLMRISYAVFCLKKKNKKKSQI